MDIKSGNVSRPVLRYHGGKWLLAPWIISQFPEHTSYVELFGGAASVLMRKPRSKHEVYNDLWDTVVNVFQVLRNKRTAKELERRIRLTPFARAEFELTGEIDLEQMTDTIEKARLTILRSFSGFGSAATNAKYATGFRAHSRKSGTSPARDWMNYPDHIKLFTERLKGVTIERKNYKDVVAQQDDKSTLFYADPPYVHETRNMARGNAAYEKEMTNEDHIEMAEVLSKVKGMVVISGYECDLYNDLFGRFKKIKRIARADGAGYREECLWLSKNVASKLNLLF